LFINDPQRKFLHLNDPKGKKKKIISNLIPKKKRIISEKKLSKITHVWRSTGQDQK
jgi:hypothetical protein